VWPWRLAFAHADELRRSPLVAPRGDGSFWPLDELMTVALLEARAEDSAAGLVLDQRAFRAAEDRSPRLAIRAGPAGAELELVLYTEIGYEPYPCGRLGADGAAALSMMQLLELSNGITAAGFLRQAADLGAMGAYLEARALAADGTVLAASRWLPIAWPPELLALSLR
jgi:hypothetical protein